MPLPPARWYFDADTVGTGKALSSVRDDVTWPGDTGERHGRPARRWLPASPIASTDVDDDVWIPVVTAAGMAIITRDHRIQTRLGERQVVADSRARMFAIAGGGAMRGWELLEIVVHRWRDMEEMVATTPGPWICTITRGSRPHVVLP